MRPITSSPAISIGLPVYNGEAHLDRTIGSILAQDHDDFELIIADNASTDRSGAICQEFVARDSRVRYYRNEQNIGAGPNHNWVFARARGRYFKWAAHDVECLPGFLRRCHEISVQAPRASLVYPQCRMIDASGRFGDLSDVQSIQTRAPHPHQRLGPVIRNIKWVNHLYGLMPVELLKRTRLIDSFASSDYVLLAELAILGEIVEIPDVLLERTMDAERGAAAHWGRKSWGTWLNPAQGHRGDPLGLEQRLFVEYVRSALRLPRSPLEKILCVLAVICAHGRRTVIRPARRWCRARFSAGSRSANLEYSE